MPREGGKRLKAKHGGIFAACSSAWVLEKCHSPASTGQLSSCLLYPSFRRPRKSSQPLKEAACHSCLPRFSLFLFPWRIHMSQEVPSTPEAQQSPDRQAWVGEVSPPNRAGSRQQPSPVPAQEKAQPSCPRPPTQAVSVTVLKNSQKLGRAGSLQQPQQPVAGYGHMPAYMSGEESLPGKFKSRQAWQRHVPAPPTFRPACSLPPMCKA